MQNDWAYNEMCRAVVWDKRCLGTLVLGGQRLAEEGQTSFSRALGSVRKSVSRILHHPTTTPENLLAGHIRASSVRCQAYPSVLVPSDTTYFDFSSHRALSGLGPIGTKKQGQGMLTP